MKTLHIKMLTFQKGQDVDENGCALPVRTYSKGVQYLVGKGLGHDLINMGAAELALVEPPVLPVQPRETKVQPEPKLNPLDISQEKSQQRKRSKKKKKV